MLYNRSAEPEVLIEETLLEEKAVCERNSLFLSDQRSEFARVMKNKCKRRECTNHMLVDWSCEPLKSGKISRRPLLQTVCRITGCCIAALWLYVVMLRLSCFKEPS